MAARKRTAFQIEENRHQIASLYLRGLTQAAIGERLNMARNMVTYDLKVIRDRWRDDTTRDLDADKMKELAKIDELERTYWTAWESSLGQKEINATERVDGAGAGVDGVRTKAMIRKEHRDGNPAFLDGVMRCIERRCKLLGLDQQPGSSPETPFYAAHSMRREHDFRDTPDDDLDAILGIVGRARLNLN